MLGYLLIVCILVLRSAAQQKCPPIISTPGQTVDNTIPQLQAASVGLPKSSSSASEANFNVTLKSTTTASPYDVAVAISYIQNYFDPAQLNFTVRSINFPTYFTINFKVGTQASWVSVHIHYLATSRAQIRAGNFIAPQNQLILSPNSSRLTVTYSFADRKWTGNSTTANVAAFIAGVVSNDRFLDISISSSSANISLSTLTVVLNLNSKYPLLTLVISYVMYNDLNSPVSIRVLSNATELASLEQASFINHTQNQFLGIGNISAKLVNVLFSTVSNTTTTPRIPPVLTASGVLDIYPLSRGNIEAFQNAFQLQGLVLASKLYASAPILQESSTNLGNLTLNNSVCITYQQCVVNRGGLFIYIEDDLTCVICRNNSQFDPVSKKCLCKEGFVPLNGNNATGACLRALGNVDFPVFNNTNVSTTNNNATTPATAVNNNGSSVASNTSNATTVCLQNFTYNVLLRRCVCKPNFINYISPANQIKCASPCTANLTFNTSQEKCTCKSGIYFNGVCVNCNDSLAAWNELTNKCECYMGSTNVLGGPCQLCSPFSTYDKFTKTCKCNQGYFGSGIVCRRTESILAPGYTIIFLNQPSV